MKKYILTAIAGALAMLIVITVMATAHANKERVPKEYEHIDYVSTITPEECYVCGDVMDFAGLPYWGEDNVGIVNLNTFELLRLEINRYDDHGNLIKEAAGYMSTGGLSNKETDTYVHAFTFPDNAYADVKLSGVQYAIDRDSIQSHLCQTCLDSINDLWFTDQPPAEFAIISFEDRTIQPLLNAHPWFAAGNYGIDCEFNEDGQIDLLIHYCPPRYENSPSQNDGLETD